MAEEDQTTSSDESPGRRPGGRRRASRRPIWRRGWFWVAVIGAELALALIVSFTFERSPTEVDVSGGDLAAFCDQARALRDQEASIAGNGADAIDDPSRFIAERDAYRALVASAPPDLIVDLEQLADAADELVVTIDEVAARKAEDPSYSGLADVAEALERAGDENKVAAARVNLVLQDECGILPTPASTATTAAPTVAVPGTPPP